CGSAAPSSCLEELRSPSRSNRGAGPARVAELLLPRTATMPTSTAKPTNTPDTIADIAIPRAAETVHEGARPSLSLFDVSPLLEKWVEVGVLTPVLWDRIQVCPRCHGMPRYRKGCRSCGSVKVTNERLIHHFACAHVAPVSDFEKSGELVCPKCRMRRMIV